LKRKNQRNFITESLRFPKRPEIAAKPQHTGVQGVPLPVSRGSGGNRNPPAGPGSARRFWFFWRSKEQNRKVKKFVFIKILLKEPKKLYNGKLTLS